MRTWNIFTTRIQSPSPSPGVCSRTLISLCVKAYLIRINGEISWGAVRYGCYASSGNGSFRVTSRLSRILCYFASWPALYRTKDLLIYCKPVVASSIKTYVIVADKFRFGNNDGHLIGRGAVRRGASSHQARKLATIRLVCTWGMKEGGYPLA